MNFDLSASPDIEAYWSYVLVLALGAITAIVQINRKLQLPGKWTAINTWLLLAAYTVLPIVLFLVLDALNALHDTSLFAAVLVGVAYQQILTGGITAVKAGQVSKIWEPFSAWADYIGTRIADRMRTNDSLFGERFLADVSADAAKTNTLLHIALTHAKDAALLKVQFDALNSPANVAILAIDGVRFKQAQLLYDALQTSSPNSYNDLLYDKEITSLWTYWWFGKEGRSQVTVLAVLVCVGLISLIPARTLLDSSYRGNYYSWRVLKPNTTEADRFRALSNLTTLVQNDPSALQKLTERLASPALTQNGFDSVMTLLLRSKQSDSIAASQAYPVLADALRTSSIDRRARIQEVLVEVATSRGLSIEDDLKSWTPKQKDSIAEIEKHINQWKQIRWTSTTSKSIAGLTCPLAPARLKNLV